MQNANQRSASANIMQESHEVRSLTEQSKLTTVRIPKSIWESIHVEAKDENVGFNTILNRVLRKHIEWDRPAQKSKMVSLPREFLVRLIEDAYTELPNLTREFSRIINELVMLWNLEVGCDFDEFLKLYSRHGGIGSVFSRYSTTSSVIHIRHEMGEEFSTMFGEAFKTIVEKGGLQNVDLNIQENSLSLTGRRKKAK